MQTHQVPLKPAPLGEDPEPLALANCLLWHLLHMPVGGLYAKWNEEARRGVWFFSAGRDFVFQEPTHDSTIFTDSKRARFRSCIFRLATLCDEGLNGTFAFEASNGSKRKLVVQSSFYPEAQIGLWIAITTTDSPIQSP